MLSTEMVLQPSPPFPQGTRSYSGGMQRSHSRKQQAKRRKVRLVFAFFGTATKVS